MEFSKYLKEFKMLWLSYDNTLWNDNVDKSFIRDYMYEGLSVEEAVLFEMSKQLRDIHNSILYVE